MVSFHANGSTETTPLKGTIDASSERNRVRMCYGLGLMVAFAVGTFTGAVLIPRWTNSAIDVAVTNSTDQTLNSTEKLLHTGPYKIVEIQSGGELLEHYDFYEGPDSVGSAGYANYVSRDDAVKLGIVNTTMDSGEEVVYMASAPTDEGPRASIRLEGKTHFNRGLFVLDLRHIPAGCGTWPAFWLTDEAEWPNSGEIDIVEGYNYETNVKTTLHTSDQCDMFHNVAPYAMTGTWDRATGIPDEYTGIPNYKTNKEADNCYSYSPHQWNNQGCVLISDNDQSLGAPLNAIGGGIFATEWDPEKGRIRSWAFSPRHGTPRNLVEAMERGSSVAPDPDYWGYPYAHFSIGEGTRCSADHFKNNRLVINLAFCGSLAGNRFFADCKKESEIFNDGIPVSSCNKYVASDPEAMDEAYWKIRSVHVWERELENNY